MSVIYRETQRCKCCSLKFNLSKSLSFHIQGTGEIFFISDHPTEAEIIHQKLFVGVPGLFFRSILDKLDNYVLATTVQCPSYEDSGKIRTPTSLELLHCGWHIRSLIAEYKPRLVFLLGKAAAANFGFSDNIQTLVEKSPYTLTEFPETKFYVLYHPIHVSKLIRGYHKQNLYYLDYVNYIYKILEKEGILLDHQSSDAKENLNNTTHSHSEAIEILERFRGIDFSLDFETIGSEVYTDRAILGIGLGTDQQQVYIDVSKADPVELKEIFQALSDLIDYNQARGKKVLVYNQSFESGVMFQILQDRIRFFDDVWTMAKSLGYSGSLKDLARVLLQAPEWADEIQEIVTWSNQLIKLESNKPGILKSYLFHQSTSKTLDRLMEQKPTFISTDQLISSLELFERKDDSVGWSLIPLDIMSLYNARDTYWTYRLWQYFRHQLSAVFQEVYQEQENLSTVIQMAKLKISEENYLQMKVSFLTHYLKSLAEFLSHPIAYEEVWKRQLYSIPINKSPILKALLPILRQSFKKSSEYTELVALSWEELRSKPDQSEVSESILEFLSEREESLVAHCRKSWDELLTKIAQLDVSTVQLSDLEQLMEELDIWYNPRSPIQGLYIFNRVTDHPVLNTMLYLYQITVVLGDHQVSNLLQKYGAFTTWLEKSEEILKDIPKSVKAIAAKQLQELRGSFDGDHLNLIYAALSRFLEFHVDRPETYPSDPELRGIVEAYIQLRKAKKAIKVVSTYLDGRTGLRDAITASTVEVNNIPLPVGSYSAKSPWAITDYIAIGTDTHRWSSPYHTIPSGTEVRDLYESRWGSEGLFIHYDYAQMEVRVLAALAKEEKLLQLLLDPKADVHLVTASLIFNIPPAEVQTYQRRYAKSATFAILYGKSLHSFATTYTAGSIEQAQAVFDAYFKAFPGIDKWIKSMHRLADYSGKVSTLFHEHDYLDVQMNEAGYNRRAQNYPVQSSASSLAAISAMRAFREAQAKNVRLIPIGFTHDALDFEVHIADLPQALDLIYNSAVQWVREVYQVPVQIDFELGTTGNLGVELVRKDTSWEMSGFDRYLNPVLERISSVYDYELLFREQKSKRVNLETIFVGRAAMSQYVGQELPFTEMHISIPKLRSKRDIYE